MSDDWRAFEVKVETLPPKGRPKHRRRGAGLGYVCVDIGGLLRICGGGAMDIRFGMMLARHSRMQKEWLVMSRAWREQLGLSQYACRTASAWMRERPEWFEVSSSGNSATRVRLTRRGAATVAGSTGLEGEAGGEGGC